MSRNSLQLLRTLPLFALLVLTTPRGSRAAENSEYRIDYTVRFLPAEKAADVTMEVRPGTGRAKQFTFKMDPARYSGIEADKGIEIEGRE